MSEPKPVQERVSVLETRMDGHDTIVEHNQELLLKFFDRFEQLTADSTKTFQDHIRVENKHDQEIQIAMSRIADQLVDTNATLVKIEEKTTANSNDIGSAKGSWKTIKVIAAVIAFVITSGIAMYNITPDHFHVEIIKAKI